MKGDGGSLNPMVLSCDRRSGLSAEWGERFGVLVSEASAGGVPTGEEGRSLLWDGVVSFMRRRAAWLACMFDCVVMASPVLPPLYSPECLGEPGIEGMFPEFRKPNEPGWRVGEGLAEEQGDGCRLKGTVGRLRRSGEGPNPEMESVSRVGLFAGKNC